MQSKWPSVPAPDPSQLVAYRYRLGQSLGAGALGEAFYAEDIKFEPPRVVALKLLHRELLADPEMCAQVKHEAGTMARFNHPNILRIIDFEIRPDGAYLVYEFAPGGSLAKKIHPKPDQPPVTLSFEKVAHYLKQIANALDTAHEAGLIHRDIKPQNILLDEEDRALLADFGLAMALSGKKKQQLMQADPWGTPEYAAPEVWQEKAGKPSDIYALGALIYELITGYPPFQGDLAAVREQQLHALVPPLSHYRPELAYPPELDKLFATVLAKEVKKRPKTAGEFYRKFQAIVDDAPVQVKPSLSPATRYPSVTTGIEPVTIARSPRTRRLVFIASAVGLGLLLAGVLWSLNLFGNKPALTLSGHTGAVNQVAWSPDGTYLVSASEDKTIKLWDSAGAALKTFSYTDATPYGVAWSPDSQTVAIALSNNGVLLWGIDGRTKLLKGHNGPVRSVSWSPDGTRLVSGSDDNTIKIWSAAGALLSTTHAHSSAVRVVAWSPGGKTILSGSASPARQVRWWNVSGNGVYQEFEMSGFLYDVNAIAWSPDGKKVAIGYGYNTISYYSNDHQQLDGGWLPNDVNASALVWSPDGRVLAAGSFNKSISLLEHFGSYKQAELGRLGDTIRSLGYSPDGTRLASAADKNIYIWKLK